MSEHDFIVPAGGLVPVTDSMPHPTVRDYVRTGRFGPDETAILFAIAYVGGMAQTYAEQHPFKNRTKYEHGYAAALDMTAATLRDIRAAYELSDSGWYQYFMSGGEWPMGDAE